MDHWDAHGDLLPEGGWLPPAGPERDEPSAAPPQAGRGPILRVRVEPSEVTLSPGGPEATVGVRVSNAGTAVEEFVVDLPGAPSWLQVEPAEVRLLPGTAEDVVLRLRPLAAGPVAAGELPLSVRVRSAARADAVELAPLRLVVPVLAGQLTLTAEPQLLRGGGSGALRLRVTSTGNEAVTVDLRAADAEGVVRFALRPPSLSLAPYGSAEAVVDVVAPRPLRGDTVNLPLTMHARAGSHEAMATATLLSSARVTDGMLTALRVVLTLLGSLVMAAGARSTWTTAPEIGRGLEWTYDAFAAIALQVDLLSMDELGVAVPDALVSAGAVVVVLAILAVLGLVGAKGRLTRAASVLAALFVVTFVAVLFVTTGVDPAGGTTAVLVGSALAFSGGLLGRR